MRIPFATLATALMLAASGVYAQQAPTAPVRTESATSPFTYEALGATPSIQLRRASPAPAAATDTTNVDAGKPAAAPSQGKAQAAARAETPRAQAAAPAAQSTH